MDRLNRRIVIALAIIAVAIVALVSIITVLPPKEGLGSQIQRPTLR